MRMAKEDAGFRRNEDAEIEMLGNMAGRLGNIENAAANADALIKQTLAAIQSVEARLAAMDGRLTDIGNTNARLAALEAAALACDAYADAGFPAPVFLEGRNNWRLLLEGLAPGLFPLWLRLYEASLPHYSTSIEASCSTWENRFAVAFRDYVRLFARGYILDVGCGTLACPVYLEGYPASFLRGVDPREPAGPTAFPIACGVNEYLPYGDAGFQTVINATSLDHVIDMERSLEETARVLGDKGRFLIWYADIANSPPPPSPRDMDAAAPADDFHLFHIGDDWFLPLLDKRFRVIDRRRYPSGGFSHVFAAYEKR